MEKLEARLVLAQLIDLGGLRFSADSFSTTQDGYETSGGQVLIGFTPSSQAEDFRGLMVVDLDAVGGDGELQLHTSDLTFSIDGGAIDLISQRNNRRVWESALFESFPILSLTTTDGVPLADGDAQPINVASFDFTANNLQLINPDGGDTNDSESHLRGVFDFNAVLGDLTTELPKVTVAGKDYVSISPDISPTLSGAEFDVSLYSGNVKSLPVNGSLIVTYETDAQQNDLWKFEGSISVSSQPQDNSNQRGLASVAADVGIALKNTDFDGITFGISGSFNLFAATLKTSDTNPLTFEYNFSEERYELTGGLTLLVDGNTVDMNLGYETEPDLPGIVIEQGVVQTINAIVTTDFEFFGVEFTTTPGGITFQYDRDSEQYVMFGGMQLVDHSTKNPVFALQMGTSSSDAGLRIQDGSLKQIEAAITSNAFKAGPLTWRVADAGFKWTKDTDNSDVFIVSGSLFLQEIWQVAVTLGDGVTGDNSGLKYSSGGFELDGFEVVLKNVNVGFLTFEELLVGYQKDINTGDFDVDLAGDLFFPETGKSFAAAMVFDTDKEAITSVSIGMDFGNQPVALGSSGMFLTAFDVAVQNPNSPSSFQITGDVAVIYGEQLKLAGQDVTIIAGVGTVTVTRDEFVLGADIYWGAQQDGTTSDQFPEYKGVLGSGSGTLTLDWGNKDYELDVNVKMYKGAFDVSGSFQFDGTGSNYFIYFRADAKVSVPSGIPFIGGKELADFHFVFDYHSKDQVTGEPVGYVAAWTKLNFLVTKKDVGFLFDINDSGASNPKSIGKHAIKEIKDGDYGPDTKLYTYSKSFQVPTGASVTEFQVQWPEAKGTQYVAYEFVATGDGHDDKNIVQQSDFGKGNNATLVTNSTDAPTSTLLTQITDPQLESAGTYYYYLYSTEKFSDPDTQLDWQFTYSIPSPVASLASELPSGYFTDPSIGVDIYHEVGPGLASQTTVTLYADTDNQGYDGFKVNSFIPSSDKATYDGLPWNLTNLPLGKYYLYVSIHDGENPTTYSDYSTQASFQPTGPISGFVQDAINGNVGVPGVKLYLDVDSDGSFDPSTEASWTTNGDGYYRFDYADAARSVALQNGDEYPIGLVTSEGIALKDASQSNPRSILSPDLFGDDTTFGLQINSSIAGTVFNDANQNGVLDPEEKGAQGWTVYVDLNQNGELDVTDPSAVSASDGAYRIFDLEPNTTYSLRLFQDSDSQADFLTTSPTSQTLMTPAGNFKLVSDQDFGVLQFASVSGTVDNYDLKSDGSLNTDTSPPPANWEVRLLAADGSQVATTYASTDDGSFHFDNVTPGTYSINQAGQADWLQVSPVTANTPAFTHTFYAAGDSPTTIAQADFDQDGDLDLATVAPEKEAGTVSFFLNDGAGKFTKSSQTASVKFNDGQAWNLQVIHGLPGATGPSLAVISGKGWVSLLKNTTAKGGGLSFAATNSYVHFIHADTMHGVTAGDFDEDGITDLAGSHSGTSGNPNRFDVLLLKDGTRVDGKHYDVPGQLVAADMNGDGHQDLVLNSDNSEHNFNVAYGDGTGAFSNITTWALNGGANNFSLSSDHGPVAVSDFNADGLLDIAFGTGGDFGMAFFTQTPEAGFFFLEAIAIETVGLSVDRIQGQLYPNPVVLTGDPDLEIFEFVDDATEVPAPISTFADAESPAALNVVDVNNDGLPDLLVVDQSKGGVWVYLNTTPRTEAISLTAGAGQNLGNLTFTNYQTAQVTGVTYDDTDFSGTRQGFESGLKDIRVYVDDNGNGTFDTGEPFTWSNATGAYAFNNLPDGRHQIRVERPDGFLVTSPSSSSHEIVIENGVVVDVADATFDFGMTAGIHLSRYTDSVDEGNEWTLRRNGAYLELIDNQTGGLLSQHRLERMHQATIYTSNFAPDSLTIDFQFGGEFALPRGILVDGGRDGLAGQSVLRFLGSDEDDIVQISETQATINDDLVISWTDNLGSVIFKTGGGNDVFNVSGTPLSVNHIELDGGSGDDVYHLAVENVLLRITDQSGDNLLDFSEAIAPVSIDLALQTGQVQAVGAGNNQLSFYGKVSSLIGTPFADTLRGSDLDDYIQGLAGNDFVNGREGDDLLFGGTGRDILLGGEGHDGLQGDDDADVLVGGEGQDSLNGGSDQDVLMGGDGDDQLRGGSGDDWLDGGRGNDQLTGVDPDSLHPGRGERDSFLGGPGMDLFVLGDAQGAYYVSSQEGFLQGATDFARLLDFHAPDAIQLVGDQSQYDLEPLLRFSWETGLYFQASNDWELIATVLGVRWQDPQLRSNRFRYVPSELPPLSTRHLDTNDDGVVSTRDALVVINAIARSDGSLADFPQGDSTRNDVNGDGTTTPRDALIILNHLAKSQLGIGLLSLPLLPAGLTPMASQSMATKEVLLESVELLEEVIDEFDFAPQPNRLAVHGEFADGEPPGHELVFRLWELGRPAPHAPLLADELLGLLAEERG
ncbi:FG-GAP-like repeat-containing protein [Roseiconus nitratireducens]|nr:FG-GAP-like repeat-containing protein [Roseiconus nitratireducens]